MEIIRDNIGLILRHHSTGAAQMEFSRMVGKSNGWDQLYTFFHEDKRIKPTFEEVVEECHRDNCQSAVTMMILTIERLLDENENLKEELGELQ